jgi:hypothetical protein
VAAVFQNADIHFYKNTKIITAEGAATVAAIMLDAIDGVTVAIEDKHQLSADIGLQAGRFLPLAERNSFWWQKHPVKYLLVNDAIDGELPLELAERNADGDVRRLLSFSLDGLPKRPKGATRLSVKLKFYSNEEFTVTIRDQGFGELFPRQEGFEKSFDINLSENFI